MQGDSVSYTFLGSGLPWHRQMPGSNLAHSVLGQLDSDWQFIEHTGHFAREFSSGAVAIITPAALPGCWSYALVDTSGFCSARPSGMFPSLRLAAEAAEARLRELGLLASEPAPPPPQAEPEAKGTP